MAVNMNLLYDSSNKKFDRATVDSMFRLHPRLTILFTKKDGSSRLMTCVRDLRLIPISDHPKPKDPDAEVKPPSDTICTVYEVGNGWRSCRYDSIISIKMA